MNNNETLRQTENLKQVFLQHTLIDNMAMGEESERNESDILSSVQQLELFAAMKRQTEIQAELFQLQNALERESFAHHDACKHAYENEEHFSKITECVDFICTYSKDIKCALTNPIGKDVIPLSHHLHRKAVAMMDGCAWLLKNKNWRPSQDDKRFSLLISKLKQEVANWKSLSMQLERYLHHDIFLRENVGKMLESMAVLCE